MASFELWMDGPEMTESAGWRQSVAFNFARFAADPEYAEFISSYVRLSLEHLARELEEIDMKTPPGHFDPQEAEFYFNCD